MPPQGSAAALQLCLDPRLRLPQHALAGMLQTAELLRRHLKAAERGRQPVPYLQAQEHRLHFSHLNRWAIRHMGVQEWDTHAHNTNMWQCMIPSLGDHCQGYLIVHCAAKLEVHLCRTGLDI